MNNLPLSAMPCWYVTEEERILAIRNREPYVNRPTDDYFLITNRIDNIFIEGHIGRKDRILPYLNDVREQLTYLLNYTKREKVYFTFDRISLYKLVGFFPSAPNPIRFMLKRIDDEKAFKKNQAFMIMPFHHQDLNNFYFSLIKPFLKEKLNIDIYRSDDFSDNDVIIDTIYKLIEESEFIIADTTVENKNSFYELGYASAIGKEIITIQNKAVEQRLFFDRAHIRSILYDPNDVSGFNFELEATIKSIRNRL